MNAPTCLDWDSVFDGAGSPGFNEDDNFEHISSLNCQNHINAHTSSGGTGSFEYNRIDDWHFGLTNNVAGEHGLNLAPSSPGVGMQGDVFDLKTNVGGSTTPGGPVVALVYVDGNNLLFRSHINLHGENTSGIPNAYSVYVANGLFYNEGNSVLSGLPVYSNPSSGGVYVLHPGLSDIVSDIDNGQSIHYEVESSSAYQRNCKFDLGPVNARFWLASYGGVENDCQFQILGRNTDNTNQDVYRAGTGSAPVNILYADPLSKSIGIGAGFGTVATGTAQPQHTIDVHGDMAVTNPTISTTINRQIQPSGTMTDSFAGSSSVYQQLFYDPTISTTDTGLTAAPNNGHVYYTFYTVANTRGTPSSSSDACMLGESWDDVNYHYHCVATNTIKRVALTTF